MKPDAHALAAVEYVNEAQVLLERWLAGHPRDKGLLAAAAEQLNGARFQVFCSSPTHVHGEVATDDQRTVWARLRTARMKRIAVQALNRTARERDKLRDERDRLRELVEMYEEEGAAPGPDAPALLPGEAEALERYK